MKTYQNVEELQTDSIRVLPGMITVFPQFDHAEEKIDCSKAPKFNGCYATNNSTVAFVVDGTIFVTPYTRGAVEVLRGSGFSEKIFYVPFSNGDYPKWKEQQWEELRKSARKDANEVFVLDCIEHCSKNGISALDDEILANCFKMPTEGVRVKRFSYESVYYPILTGNILDCNAIENIGTYCANNGCVVFVHNDGRTYVTIGYKIISVLIDAGYKEKGLFVPFSNWEEILDPVLSAQWDKIQKW